MPTMRCKAIVTLVLCFFIFVANTQAQSSLSEGQAFEQDGMTAYRAGDFLGAITGFELALENRPGHSRLVIYLASVHAELGNADAAMHYLEIYAQMGLSRALNKEDFPQNIDAERFADVAAKMVANNTPLAAAELAFATKAPVALSEGIAFDPESGDYFISSIYDQKIMRVTGAGKLSVFTEGLVANPMALAFDEKRGLLWVATTILPQTRAQYFAERQKQTGVMAFARDGERVHHFNLFPDFFEGEEQNISLGDVFVAGNGDVFLSNSSGQDVFRLRYGEKLKVDSFTIENSASLQGMTMLGGTLFVMDYSTGLHSLNVETGASQWLTIPDGVTLLGIDGLYAHDGKLIAVQNGIRPSRVIEISLADDHNSVAGVEVLEQAHAYFSEPTNGVIVGDEFYFIANSGWAEFGNIENITSEMLENLAPTKIMKINLAD